MYTIQDLIYIIYSTFDIVFSAIKQHCSTNRFLNISTHKFHEVFSYVTKYTGGVA